MSFIICLNFEAYEKLDVNAAENLIDIDEESFPDEILREYVKEEFDTDNDGKLSSSEISNATKIQIYSKDQKVSSLEGIEYLPSLTNLIVGYGSFETVDVSKNTELTKIVLSYSSLKSIDLSKNTKLKSFSCVDANLSKIDLKNNVLLEALAVDLNPISNLDISKNTKLKELDCRDCNLSVLDVSNNTELKGIHCWRNSIGEINTKGLTKLRELGCGDNKIKELDLTDCTDLFYVSCENNQLTSLVLGKSNDLSNVYCFNNKLDRLDLSGCPNIVYLYAFNNNFDTVDISCLKYYSSSVNPDYYLVYRNDGTKGDMIFVDSTKLAYTDVELDEENKKLYYGEKARKYREGNKEEQQDQKDETSDQSDNDDSKHSSNNDSMKPEDKQNSENTDSVEIPSASVDEGETEKTGVEYRNEWINGKWYGDNGEQTYKGTLMWKSNSTGWWVEDSAGWYPTNAWQKIDGIWYYFKPDGYMASNEYYGSYWFNADGSWDDKYLLSWKQNSTGWWVEDISGWWPSSSWLKIDGYWYYFDASGYMVTSQYVDGWWISADGVCY